MKLGLAKLSGTRNLLLVPAKGRAVTLVISGSVATLSSSSFGVDAGYRSPLEDSAVIGTR
jgi:hypothetical protein